MEERSTAFFFLVAGILGDGFDLDRAGEQFLATHLDEFGKDDISFDRDDGIRRKPGDLFSDFRELFLLDRDLDLASDVLYHKKSHCLAIAQVFHKSLYFDRAVGLNVSNVCPVHRILPIRIT